MSLVKIVFVLLIFCIVIVSSKPQNKNGLESETASVTGGMDTKTGTVFATQNTINCASGHVKVKLKSGAVICSRIRKSG